METLLELLLGFKGTPVPSILAILGGILVVLSIVGSVSGTISLSKQRQALAAAVGALFLVVGIGLFLVPETNPAQIGGKRAVVLSEIYRIDFDYDDAITQHGWEFVDIADRTKVAIEHVSGSSVENAISIESTEWYGLEYRLKPGAQFGDAIEVVLDPGQDAAFYAYVGMKRRDGSDMDGWLKFVVGKGRPEPVQMDTSTEINEWKLPIEPAPYHGSGNWVVFRVDLENAVKSTFGKNGWSFHQLHKIRIRGNLSLNYISILNKTT